MVHVQNEKQKQQSVCTVYIHDEDDETKPSGHKFS